MELLSESMFIIQKRQFGRSDCENLVHPLGHVWSTKPLISLMGFGAKNMVRVLASRTLCPSASTTASSSPYGIHIISELRKHVRIKHTMKSLQKKASKSVNIFLRSDRSVKTVLLFHCAAFAALRGHAINMRARAWARRLPYWAIPLELVATLVRLWGSSFTAEKLLKNVFYSLLS